MAPRATFSRCTARRSDPYAVSSCTDGPTARPSAGRKPAADVALRVSVRAMTNGLHARSEIADLASLVSRTSPNPVPRKIMLEPSIP